MHHIERCHPDGVGQNIRLRGHDLQRGLVKAVDVLSVFGSAAIDDESLMTRVDVDQQEDSVLVCANFALPNLQRYVGQRCAIEL